MNRRQFLATSGASAIAAAAPGAFAQSGTADARLRAMLDRFFYERLADSPEGATRLGLDTGPRAALRGKLSDTSAAGAARDLSRTKAQAKQLATIDRAALSEAGKLDYDVVAYQFDRSIGGERFGYGETAGRYAPYILSQLTGSYREVPDFLDSQHRVKDAADADAYLSRLEAFPAAMDGELARQRADAAKGVFAPDYILDTTMKMQAALRDQPAAQTVLVTSFVKKLKDAGLPPERARQAERIVAEKIFPALDRQRALVQALRAKASHDAGVWRLPDGEAFYAAAEAATTTRLTGDEIHRIGLDQVAEISARIDTILKGQGMSQGSVGDRLVELNKRPDQLYPNTDPGREALLAQLNRQIVAMQKRLPESFSPATLPKAPVEVRRVPVTIQAGAPGGYYQNASLDGSRPAIYFINLRDTFDRPKFGLATLTHHEAVPGHHLQVSVALESDAIPMIRRRGGFSGYTEGWALYSEQLADEMGMYEGDPLGQVGYLQSLLFRATRLVVDSGMHAKRWSREKATDYLIATTGIARGRSQGEIDRYTVWPGQACSYKIGHTVWNDLRSEVKKKQGAAFDLKAFHEVLTLGAMPLDILKQTVRRRAGIV
jgi:uncharacterized protein (DUF885 family)